MKKMKTENPKNIKLPKEEIKKNKEYTSKD